jgi:hypothetical protein
MLVEWGPAHYLQIVVYEIRINLILMQHIFLCFAKILLSEGIVFLCHYNQKKKLTESIKKIIGHHLKNKSCP